MYVSADLLKSEPLGYDAANLAEVVMQKSREILKRMRRTIGLDLL